MANDKRHTNGFFIGTEKAGEGVNKAGKKWKKYSHAFKPSLDSQKAFHISEFVNCTVENGVEKWTEKTVFQEDLEYNLAFYENPGKNQAGQPIMYKTLAGATQGHGAVTPRDAQPSQQQQIPQPQSAISFNELDGFAVVYKEAVPKEINPQGDKVQLVQSPVHMAGMFLINTYPDQFWELYVRCCKALGVEIPKR